MKKATFLAAVGTAAISSLALGANPTTQPVMPVDQIPVPAARTAAVAPAQDHLAGTVMIFAFSPTGDAKLVAWVGHAVQESLVADLSRVSNLHPTIVTGDGQVDEAAALAKGKSAHVDAVIVGSFQGAGAQIRFTGQVLSVTSGQSLGGLKASGDFRDLFAMEDDLGKQAKQILRPTPAADQVKPLTLAQQTGQIFNGGDVGMSEDELNRSLATQPQFGNDYERYNRTPGYYGYGGSYYGCYDNYPFIYYSNPGFGWGGFPIVINRIIIGGHGGSGGVVVPPRPVGHLPGPVGPPQPGHWQPL